MSIIENISISHFLFALENLLLTKKCIKHIREVDWTTVDYFARFVTKEYPYFKLDKKQFVTFKHNYNHRLRKLQHHPVDLEPLTEMLRKVAPPQDMLEHPGRVAQGPRTSSETGKGSHHQSALAPVGSLRSPLEEAEQQTMVPHRAQSGPVQRPEGDEVRTPNRKGHSGRRRFRPKAGTLPEAGSSRRGECPLCGRVRSYQGVSTRVSTRAATPEGYELLQKLVSEIADFRAALTKQVEALQAQVVSVHSGLRPERVRPRTISDFQLILQSITSTRPFTRARKRVTLLVLYIAGLTPSTLRRLTVLNLKELTQFAQSGQLPWDVPLRADAQQLVTSLLQDLNILIADCPDQTPAFRATLHSTRPCTREALSRDIHKILASANQDRATSAKPAISNSDKLR